MQPREIRPYDKVKRAVDVAGSIAGIAITAPVQMMVAALVWLEHGQPVLFRQQRPGVNGTLFELVKFRTMRHPDASHVTDEERLTGLGRFLRATSLDELPTLWNVLRGDMSLVGPRPLLVKYLDLYTPTQARRHEVRPGITGLAQASGRNGLRWEDKFRLDVEYVDNRSLYLDIRILWMTAGMVLKRTGIGAPGRSTAAEFTGSHDWPSS